MKTKSKLFLALAGMSLVNMVWAVPTIYPTKLTNLALLKNTTNSNIVADTVNDSTFWVMPPNTGKSVVKGLHSFTANLGFCREMQDAQAYSRSTLARMNRLGEMEMDAKTKLDAKYEELSKARQTMAEHVANSNLTELSNIDERIVALDTQISDINDKLESCGDHCDELLAQSKELRQEKKEEVARRRELYAQGAAAARTYERMKKKVEMFQADIADLNAVWAPLSKAMADLRVTFQNIYKGFADQEGARASIMFDSKWDENVLALRNENPGYSFNKISTQNAVITNNIIATSELPSNGAIKSYQVGGTVSDGKLTLPAYPENLSGNVVLSLVGACPILHPEYFDINRPTGTDQMDFGMIVSYEYPTAFVASLRVEYNMHKMYQKIAKSGKKGGFFSSRSWSSVEEKTEFSDSFKSKWVEQDSSATLTETEKADLEREIRNGVFARLAALALPTTPNAGSLIAPEVPKTGAVVLGESLAKNRACQSNIYCVGATIGVNVLAAIFGSSSSAASYTNIQDVWLTDDWSREKVVFKPWITAYK